MKLKKADYLNYYEGLNPRCESLTHHRRLLLFQKHTPEGPEKIYVLLGCNNRRICLNCGQLYSKTLYEPTRNLLLTLWRIFPQMEVAHIVLTVPHDHEFFLNPSKLNFNKLFRLANSFIKMCFPDTAALLVLHNWSSRNPEMPHLHIHCFIFGVTSEATLTHFWIDSDIIRERWQEFLCYWRLPVVHIEYYYKHDAKKALHALRYIYRSPIEDYCKDGERPLSREFLKLTYELVGIHRFRYIGWLAPCHRKKVLEKLGIVEVTLKRHENWEYIGSWTVMLLPNTEYLIFPSGYSIRIDEVRTQEILRIKKVYRLLVEDQKITV